MRAFIILLILCFSLQLRADYLIAYRNTTLKKKPQSSANPVIGGAVKEGDILELLDSAKQTNGYYHVQLMGTSIDGYIYRSLVRRESGDIPGFLNAGGTLEVTVVDVGAGLGCIIKTPGDQYIIYDGGNGNMVHTFLKSIYPVGRDIAYVIASHTDSDHWGAIKEIAEDYKVKKSLITSYRPDGLPGTVSDGILELKKDGGMQDLAKVSIAPGTVIYQEGDLRLRYLSGFGKRDDRFAKELGNEASKLRNAASIVLRLEYADKAILFTGDIVGLEECKKSKCDCDYKCISSEKYLIDSLSGFLEANVIIAPHHGARNASCPDFIEKVNPDYVIFSAGDKHKHPHDLTANNYLAAGVPLKNIFRTDIGAIPEDTDTNLCNNEWVGTNEDRTDDDGSFDDHIKIQITSEGRLLVGYLE
ncbi:ComEC/Rec2 family competence protein [Marinoscillum sp. MHG1-6]|uniref:ComEC/Rec2 family competence protein n=1 Tax=Marinoscillum sp. MHG1-6 TaxID=2959627 RepID=UPI0021572522|nr:MBL fold metallo-hydrolase [Marinoscillum sp. MHG1-6]